MQRIIYYKFTIVLVYNIHHASLKRRNFKTIHCTGTPRGRFAGISDPKIFIDGHDYTKRIFSDLDLHYNQHGQNHFLCTFEKMYIPNCYKKCTYYPTTAVIL